ncbi:CopY/TcrY family copper transport repressor [Lactobacillus sp. PV012]|uniref:CopY/TcrY family copper transport repressor n=1 Tax=Lactobacillus sp. PV012 TaxID=2594494 RepID=UPI00223F4135|nr:CopY/TcrY family copper transport repressor [Lactobacillus sp. PV012]QNQ81580.1 CopY/TcrY family copper transport repressor [Lactobacillus sp. PV012]
MYQEISDAEWEVMRIVWTLQEAYTSDILAALKDKKSWSQSTIKTLIRRLITKGLLSSKKDGRKFIYSPLVTETQMINQSSEKLLAKMCDMHKGGAILKLLQDYPISKSDLIKIEKEVQSKLKTAPDAVACNCIDKKMC